MTTFHSFSSVSWLTTRLIVRKNITKSIKPQSRKTAKILFFFFRWASSKLPTLLWWLSPKTAAFYTEQCTSPSLFQNFEVSWGGSDRSLNNYGLISDTIFRTYTCVHKSLTNKAIIIQDCWIRNMVVCTKTGRVFGIHCWLIAWTEPGQWFFSQYCIHLLRKPVRTDLLLLDRWQSSAQACTSC